MIIKQGVKWVLYQFSKGEEKIHILNSFKEAYLKKLDISPQDLKKLEYETIESYIYRDESRIIHKLKILLDESEFAIHARRTTDIDFALEVFENGSHVLDVYEQKNHNLLSMPLGRVLNLRTRTAFCETNFEVRNLKSFNLSQIKSLIAFLSLEFQNFSICFKHEGNKEMISEFCKEQHFDCEFETDSNLYCLLFAFRK